MPTRSFVVPFTDITITPDSVKSGLISPALVTACRAVNVALFVSGNLRRDVEITVTQGSPDELKAITFLGASLRRVSPDERSISFFLMKADTKLSEMSSGSSIVMDNGIVVSKCTIEGLLEGWSGRPLFVAARTRDEGHFDSQLKPDGVYIYDPAGVLSGRVVVHASSILRFKRTPERFILDVNRHFDVSSV